MKSLILIFFIFFSRYSFSYPNFIGHGYTSCLNCHYNPFGGGQLNDYGRAVDATLISSNLFYPKTWTEEDVAKRSGFLFNTPKQKWFRPQINYRGFRIIENPNGNHENTRWITMQKDIRLTLKLGENDKFIFSADYGQIPELQLPPPGHHHQDYRSRNLYIGYRPNKKLGLYAGLMDKVYGLRVVEHIAFTRTNPLITMNDQTYGIAAHFLDGDWEGGVHGFIGNFNQDIEHRQKGLSALIEKTILNTHRVGFSALTSKSDYLTLQSLSIHGRNIVVS
jgi:hypothetical protein